MRRLFVLPAAVLLAAAAAVAAPFRPHFADLRAELEDRDAALVGDLDTEQARQKAAIARAFRLLDKDSRSTTTDLKTAGKLAKLLEKTFPEDPFLPNLLDDLLDALEGDVYDAADALFDAILALDDEALAAKGERASDAADLLLDRAFDAETRAARAKLLGAALKRILKGAKIVARGLPEIPDLRGTFTGTYTLTVEDIECTFQHAGTFTLVLQQVGSTVTGTVRMTGLQVLDLECQEVERIEAEFPLEGSLEGTSFAGFFADDTGEVPATIEFDALVDGATIAGTLGGDGAGSFTATR